MAPGPSHSRWESLVNPQGVTGDSARIAWYYVANPYGGWRRCIEKTHIGFPLVKGATRAGTGVRLTSGGCCGEEQDNRPYIAMVNGPGS